jgi:acyl-CoA reductase-like NAD-dependent aldehyde dehydrogenase
MTEPHFTHRIAEPVAPVGRLEVVNPFDLRPIATVDVVDRDAIDRALAVAHALFRDQVVARLAKGGFYHAGQVCVSVQRVYADRTIAEPLVRALAAAGSAMPFGDPTREETAVGPLIRPAEITRIHARVREAIDSGATLIADEEPHGETCYAPTVLLDPPEDAAISTQEIFGPVIAVYRTSP